MHPRFCNPMQFDPVCDKTLKERGPSTPTFIKEATFLNVTAIEFYRKFIIFYMLQQALKHVAEALDNRLA